MDHNTFDALTRSAVAETGTRRSLLRLLAASAFVGLAARLGLTEISEATPKKGKGKPKSTGKANSKPAAHTAAKSPGHPQSGGVQSAGKGKGKHHKPPKDPRARCSAGQKRCPDGSCIPDQPFTCCPGQRDCGDEGCYPASKCCPSQAKCPDGSCRRLERYECCPGQKSCGDEG